MADGHKTTKNHVFEKPKSLYRPPQLVVNLIYFTIKVFETISLITIKFILNIKKTKYAHHINVSLATYSPWWSDVQFQKVYANIKDNTVKDIFRLYEIWLLIAHLKHVEGDFLEVGVWKGGSGFLISEKVRMENIDANIYLCDTFEGVVKSTDKDSKFSDGEYSDTSKQIVIELLSEAGLERTEVLQGIFPDDTGSRLENCQFRFCHIDVDTYGSMHDVTNWVFDRLSSGGVIVFDDYGSIICEGVTEFVEEFRKTHPCLFIHNLNGHGVLIKN